MAKLLFLCFLLMALCNGAIIVRKSIGLSTEYPTPAVDTDVILSVQVFNRGDHPVYNVHLTDYVPKDFEVVSGSVKSFWPEIPAGTNYTHTYVLRTSKLGVARFSWATVTYRESQTSQETLAYSNYLGTAEVVPANELALNSGPNFRAWAVFFLIYLAVVGGPYLVYSHSKSQFIALSKKTE